MPDEKRINIFDYSIKTWRGMKSLYLIIFRLFESKLWCQIWTWKRISWLFIVFDIENNGSIQTSSYAHYWWWSMNTVSRSNTNSLRIALRFLLMWIFAVILWIHIKRPEDCLIWPSMYTNDRCYWSLCRMLILVLFMILLLSKHQVLSIMVFAFCSESFLALQLIYKNNIISVPIVDETGMNRIPHHILVDRIVSIIQRDDVFKLNLNSIDAFYEPIQNYLSYVCSPSSFPFILVPTLFSISCLSS